MILLNKNQIRQKILKQRDVSPDSQRLVAEAIAIKKAIQLLTPLLTDKTKIAGYYPSGSEFNILPLLEQLANKVQILLPVIQQSMLTAMKFYPWLLSSPMSPSRYARHILEPSVQLQEEIPNIIIVPLIACDLEGNRIGSGKAMYDKAIAGLLIDNPHILSIGLCFDFQLLDKFSAEEHDQKLDIILTESREIYTTPFPLNQII